MFNIASNKFRSICTSAFVAVATSAPLASFAADGAASGSSTDYAGQAMDSLSTQATDLIGKVWPVVVAVVGAGLGIRLFKKFSSKAV